MMRVAPWAIAVLVVACADQGPANPVGTYGLSTINGQSLPFTNTFGITTLYDSITIESSFDWTNWGRWTLSGDVHDYFSNGSWVIDAVDRSIIHLKSGNSDQAATLDGRTLVVEYTGESWVYRK